MMGSNYVDPKTVLDNVKSTTWKFRMEGGEVDKNYVFCRLCLDGVKEGKRGQIKYCGGTTNSIHMAFWKESMINRLSNLINRNRSAAKYHRFYALVYLQLSSLLSKLWSE